MKKIAMILWLIAFPVWLIAECTDLEAIDRGFTLLEGVLAFFGVSGGAVALRYIRALSSVIKSLDGNPYVSNSEIIRGAAERNEAAALKQFKTLG